jgi:hypothetical protein
LALQAGVHEVETKTTLSVKFADGTVVLLAQEA